MNKQIGIVFIHGAGLRAFIWKDISPLLPQPQLSIEFPNRIPSEKNNKGILFDDYLKSAIQQIEKWTAKEFVIVAHSIGGCLGVSLSDHFQDKVKAFVGRMKIPMIAITSAMIVKIENICSITENSTDFKNSRFL